MNPLVDCVNRRLIYSDHGKQSNMIEINFSRLRRIVQSQRHLVNPQYLYQYANHAASLEDNRHTDNGTQVRIVVSNAMGSPASRNWKGYCRQAVFKFQFA